jgi:hypothetical protein
LNGTIDHIDLTDIYRLFHPTTAQYKCFSGTKGTFIKIGHILGYQASPNKYKKIEITRCILSGHNRIKTRIKQQKKQHKILKHLETEQHSAP